MARPEFVNDLPLSENWRGFTRYADGLIRWHDGKPRHVCGRKTRLDDVEDVWAEKKKSFKADQEAEVQAAHVEAGGTLRHALGQFYDYLEHRLKTGKPEPISEATVADYKRYLGDFGRTVGKGGEKFADRPVREFGPAEFTEFAKALATYSPTTYARVVANVQAFFKFCKGEGIVAAVPEFGKYFRRPSQQAHDDKRIAEEKSYPVDQVRKLWAAADDEVKAWLYLGLFAAMDNSDLAHLTTDVLDRKGGLIDYRRRKVGKVRRVIPVRPEFWTLLDRYKRPAPADPALADRVFLTPTGLPLQRIKRSEASGKSNPIDYVAMCWTRLMIRAGLKPKLPPRRKTGRASKPDEPKRERRHKARGSKAGQGFRALRTTFPNLAPPGYRDEVEIIMGHKHKAVLLKNYLEKVGVVRLRELVNADWKHVGLKLPRRRG